MLFSDVWSVNTVLYWKIDETLGESKMFFNFRQEIMIWNMESKDNRF